MLSSTNPSLLSLLSSLFSVDSREGVGKQMIGEERRAKKIGRREGDEVLEER